MRSVPLIVKAPRMAPRPSLPVWTSPATPDPVPAAPSTTLVPLLGNEKVHQLQNWTSDFVDSSKLVPRTVAWDTRLYSDPVNKVFAPSMNGVFPARTRAWSAGGNKTNLYSGRPMLNYYPLGNAPIGLPYIPYTHTGDDIEQIVFELTSRPIPDGPRGTAYPTPYMTWIGHPTFYPPGSPEEGEVIPGAPVWIGLRHDGILQQWMRDRYLRTDGRIPGVNYCTDFCLDTVQRQFMYVADVGHPNPTQRTPSGDAIWVGGRIAKVDRTPGMIVGAQDATQYIVTDFLPGLVYPSAVDIDESQNVYTVDYGTGNIYKNLTILVTIPAAYAMRYNAGFLWVWTSTLGLYVVDATTGSYIQKVAPSQSATEIGAEFYTLSIDRFGTFGPVGNLMLSSSHGLGNLGAWTYVVATDELKVTSQYYVNNQGYGQTGDIKYVKEAFGHYLWAATYHPDQAIMVGAGFTGMTHELVAFADANAYPAEEADRETNAYIWQGLAWNVLKKGGSYDSPLNKPSLTALICIEGDSAIPGCSADEIAQMTFDDAEAWIRAGMAGSFRRDDLKNFEMYALLIHFYRGSMRYFAEGAALMASLKSWWLTKYGIVPTIPAAATPDAYYTDLGPLGGSYIVPELQSGLVSPAVHKGVAGLFRTNDVPPPTVLYIDEGLPSQQVPGVPIKPISGTHSYTFKLQSPDPMVGQLARIFTGNTDNPPWVGPRKKMVDIAKQWEPAAPTVILPRKNATLAPPDLTQVAINALSPGGWTNNTSVGKYPRERVRGDADWANYYAPGYSGSPAFACNDDHPFSYGSGDWDDVNGYYWGCGVGGHSDFWGSTAAYYDPRTGTWTMTDKSAHYANPSAGDDSPPLPFQSLGAGTYRVRRNPNGRFAPTSAHMASGHVICPEIGKIFVYGHSAFGDGTGSVGGIAIVDMATGQWDAESTAWAAGVGSLLSAGNFMQAYWLPSITGGTGGRVLMIQNDTGVSYLAAWLLDLTNKIATKVCDRFGVLLGSIAIGTLVPDDVNIGQKMLIAYGDATSYRVMRKLDKLPADANNFIASVAYPAGNPPAAITSESTWISMENLWPGGSTKIAVMQPLYSGGTTATPALYTFDRVSKVWTGPHAMTNTPLITNINGVGNLQRYRRWFWAPKYQCFGLLDGNGSSIPGSKDPAFYWLRPPAGIF